MFLCSTDPVCVATMLFPAETNQFFAVPLWKFWTKTCHSASETAAWSLRLFLSMDAFRSQRYHAVCLHTQPISQ